MTIVVIKIEELLGLPCCPDHDFNPFLSKAVLLSAPVTKGSLKIRFPDLSVTLVVNGNLLPPSL